MKLLISASAVTVSMLAAAPLWAQQSGPYYGYGPHMWDWPGGFFLGPLMMIVTIAAAVAAVVLLVRWLSPDRDHFRDRKNTPLMILEERFARGEIDKGEFEERRKVLRA